MCAYCQPCSSRLPCPETDRPLEMWCKSCLIARLDATEHYSRAREDELRMQLAQVLDLLEAAAPRQGVASCA